MGPTFAAVRSTAHLSFPKGTKITHLQWDPPEARLTIPQEPLVWCKMAMSLQHPARRLPDLSPDLEAAICQEAQTPLAELARARSEAIQEIHKLRLASKTEESRLRETLDTRVAAVAKPKQSLILQQLLDRHHYPDRRIGQELREGFPLTGWLQPSGIWPTAVLPPTLTIDQLLTNAKAITDQSLRKVRAAPTDDIKEAIWRATQDEVANGWLRMHPVHPAPHPQPVVSTRFGVIQKNKIRPIDNFRASHVNAACGTSEKVLVEGPDLIAQACLQLLARAAPSKGKDRLVGRTWDVKSAYKQLAVRADHSRFAWIAVQDPTTQRLHLAQMHSMPFGAVASVHAFLSKMQRSSEVPGPETPSPRDHQLL